MASPFALFRRHQKILTVILTGLAMFAFILLDQVSRMESTRVMPFLFAAMGAGAFWIWGEGKKGKADGTQILTGAVLGAVIGALPILTAPADRGIPTSIGTISERELFELKQDREMANSFVRQAFNERENAFGFLLQQYMFGGNSTQEIVARQLLLHEADRLGISIGNSFINDFVIEVSEQKLSEQAFRRIRGQLGLGQVQLFDLLREELRAQAAYRVINPVVVHLPEQYWQDFRKVNVRQSVDTTAIPVEAFTDAVAQPSDTSLRALFEQFGELYPMGQDPGFLQPQRRAIAWLEPDMKKLEAAVGEISDADLKARYEERKESFYKKSPALPDLDLPELGKPDEDTPEAPEPGTAPPTDGDKTPAPEKPEDGSKPEKPADDPNPKPEGDAPATPDSPAKPAPETKTPTGDVPASPPTTDKPEPKSDSPAESETPPPKSDDENSCQDEPAAETAKPADPPADTEAKAATEPPTPADSEKPPVAKPGEPKTPDKPAETPAAAPDKPASEPTDKPESPAPADTPAAETPEGTDKPTDKPESTDKPETPKVEYEPFEDVRDELLKLVKEERTRELVDERVKQAVDKIGQLRRTLRTEIQATTSASDTSEAVDDTESFEARQKAQEAELGKRLAENAATWAAENGFQFRETEALSQQELVDHEDYGKSIAVARDPFDMEAFSRNQFRQMPQTLTVAQRLFSASSALFVVETSEGQSSDPDAGEVKFAWWVTRDVEAHVATFDEAGVRKQVEKAHRLREAQPVAEKRAEAIAALITEGLKKDSGEPGILATMSDAVAEQTVTGDKDSVQLTVLPSPPFSWLQRSFSGMQSNPFAQQPQVEFGRIPGVEGAGDEFMQTVTEMQVGEVKAIPNFDRSVYYVVHVKARTPGPEDTLGIEALQQQFLSEKAPESPLFGGLARSQSSEIRQQWMTEFLKRYDVDPQVLNSI